MNTFAPVRCCCQPQKVVGMLPINSDALEKRIFDFEDGTSEVAFSSENMEREQLLELQEFSPSIQANTGKGTWREDKKSKMKTVMKKKVRKKKRKVGNTFK